MFKNDYNNSTSRSNENICYNSGGAQENERQDEIQFITKIDSFLNSPPPCPPLRV